MLLKSQNQKWHRDMISFLTDLFFYNVYMLIKKGANSLLLARRAF